MSGPGSSGSRRKDGGDDIDPDGDLMDMSTPSTSSNTRKRGREARHPVHEVFNYHEITQTSHCIVTTACGFESKGRHPGNMMSHLRSHHKEVFRNITKEWAEMKGEPPAKKSTTVVLNGVIMSPKFLELNCIRLITEFGLSFRFLDYEPFKNITQALVNAMPSGERPDLDSKKLPRAIRMYADEVRKLISLEVKHKCVSLLSDGVTKATRHFVGIKVRYGLNGKSVCRTLAVEEMQTTSSSAALKTTYSMVLKRYGIPEKAVISSTTDTAANYILAGRLLDEAAVELEVDDISLSEEWEGLFDVTFTMDDITLQAIRCAAHTLQLAIEDAIKQDPDLKVLLVAVRGLAIFLRTETMALQLKHAGLALPLLSTVTRWGSDYDMLLSVRRLKNYITLTLVCSERDKKSHFLSDEQWGQVDNYLTDLRSSRRVMKSLQRSDLKLSEFYKLWEQLRLGLENSTSTSPLKENLLRLMSERSQAQNYVGRRGGRQGERLPPLFGYPSFNAALLLDPRYTSIMKPNQIADAKAYLTELWIRLNQLRGIEPQAAGDDSEQDSEQEEGVGDGQGNHRRRRGPLSDSSDDEDEGVLLFANLIKRKNQELLAASQASGSSSSGARFSEMRLQIREKLDKYERELKPLDEECDIMRFWQKQRYTNQDLYDLAMVVLAIPATQVDVERLFSTLRFILRPQRFGLSAEHIDDIMVLISNPDLVKQVCDSLLRSSFLEEEKTKEV